MELPEDLPQNGAARVTVPTAARSVQGHRAGIVTRTLAACVDAAVGVAAVALGYAGVVAAYFVLSPRGFSFPDPGFGLLFACFLGFLVCYFTLAWATTGRTYGARLLGLRVVNSRGDRVRPLIALWRALLCVFVPIVLFWVVISRENRSAADMLLRTSVIYDWASS
ncbi:RDD family protein [Humibacillus xanthopallidus]|uniref:Putative RDD family membrane protein YckC n=1 Tax=Humibacillus xanthopallidus TaxID=412689 RepID=A0A543I0C8_9MICO|nr:RDD family protein [Humibacillus xanthopallidus]TQM64039.1 putative RDD family membrane protein YckC [Humibacillus xanthopallidus]